MPPKHQRTANGLTILNAGHPRMRALKRAGHVAEIHGNKVWNSSFLIMKYLQRRPLAEGARVLEIGCGWGLLGLWCAKRFGARVHGIDADPHVLPYLELHAEVNGLAMTGEKKTFAQLRTADLAGYDLIVGGDICFWDELSREVFNLIRRARRGGTAQVIIADPCRPPFTDLVERAQNTWDDVERVWVTTSRPVKASGELLVVG